MGGRNFLSPIFLIGGQGMQCPFCGYQDSKVIDSRPIDEGKSIRRRRECLDCKKRFTTYETVESIPLMVIKKDNTRQAFDKNKLRSGILRACTNLPISVEEVDEMVGQIESTIENSMVQEVPSDYIAEVTMQVLKDKDEVAYVRFASVTNRFNDVDSFFHLLNELKGDK